MNARKFKKEFNKNLLGAGLLGKIINTPKRVGFKSWLVKTSSGRAIIGFDGWIMAAEMYGDSI